MTSPGIYLVGREDGGVEPFFVSVFTDLVYHTGDDYLECCASALKDMHEDTGNWWWRRMACPEVIPTEAYFHALRPFPLERGGL